MSLLRDIVILNFPFPSEVCNELSFERLHQRESNWFFKLLIPQLGAFSGNMVNMGMANKKH